MSATTHLDAEAERFRRAWIVFNPGAGPGRRVDFLRRVAIEQSMTHADWTVRVTLKRGDAELSTREAIEQGAPMIVAAGGDGTLHQVVNEVMRAPAESRPALAVLPMGTGNDFAKTVKIPATFHQAFRALRTGRLIAVDVGKAGERYFINDMGLGLAARTAKRYGSLPRWLGSAGRYTGAALSAILSPWRARLLATVPNGADTKVEFNDLFAMAAISNGAYTGGRFSLNPHARVDDGLLDACICNRISRLEMMRQIPALMAGQHLSHPAITSFRAAAIRLESADVDYMQLDGEIYDFPKDGLDVSVERGAVRFLIGPEDLGAQDESDDWK